MNSFKRAVTWPHTPLIILCFLSFFGIFVYGSMELTIFGIPAGMHDLFMLVILTASVPIDDKRKSYQTLINWLISFCFISAFFMQYIDYRPAGQKGSYDLFLDNIFNAITILSLIPTVYFLHKKRYIRFQGRLVFLSVISIMFLAFNLLLTIREIRVLAGNYAAIYDYVFYVYLYVVCISSSNRICDAIRDCYNGVISLLHNSNSHLLPSKKQ